MSSPVDPPFDQPEDRPSARGQGASGSGSSVPPWDPSVPGPRQGPEGPDGGDGWATPGGYGGQGHGQGYGGQGYGGQGYGGQGYGGQGGLEPGAGYAPGYGDPYGGGPTVGGSNAYGGGPAPHTGGPGTGGWAPKPGVVPLRPLGVGEILDGAVSYIRAHARVVLGTSAIVAVIAYLIGTPLSQLFAGDTAPPGPTMNFAQLSDTVSAGAAAQAPTTIIVSLATTVLSGLLMVVVSRAVLGAPVDAGEAWRAVRPRIPGLVGVTLLTGVVAVAAFFVAALPGFLLLLSGVTVVGGVLLALGILVGLVAAIAVGVALSLAPPVYVLEGGGVVAALRRSWTLVKPRFWFVLGVTVLAAVVAWVVSLVVVAPFGLLAGGLAAVGGGGGATVGITSVLITAVGGIIGMALVTPFQAGVTGLLYVDQRMRREGFDIELQRAASSGPR